MPVACRQLAMALAAQRRRDVRERVGEAEPDHVARPRVSGTGSADVAHALLDRARDDRRRVGERAVPVEDDQL